ncbi:MAG: transporter substrate-binding domain-containing protein, partial [Oscillospiraceae bacterium]|nr:transporter substrate-binding domain-containing protein [Oscillospiraceae bacterium]
MRRVLAIVLSLVMLLALCACGSSNQPAPSAAPDADASAHAADAPAATATGVEDGVLTVAMECAYAPYNWTQSDDSNGAVPISNVPGSYANGYDVMIAKMICEANGWDLEIVQSDWDSLVPGVQTGTFDAVIAGQSMTAERAEQVDFAGPYFYATIVCVTLADSPYASATGLADLAGGSCTAQIATIWYDQCLPQIEGANVQTAAETAPAMLMALETGMVDFICTDMPTAQGAVEAY